MAAREPQVVAVVPALNEAETIGAVVAVLKQSPLLHQVIVVSDGSTDATADEARKAGADIVHEFPWRHGKGAAIQKGVALTTADIVVFFDADLAGLTVDHVQLLVEPVVAGTLVMNVGMRDRGSFWTMLARHMPLISGERAIKRSVIESIPSEYLRGWKIELALDYYCQVNTLPYGQVILSGVHIRRKIAKFGFWIGIGEYIHMFWQLAKVMVELRMNRKAFVSTESHEKPPSA